MSPTDDVLAAIHEAGHAAMASMFGYSVRCAVLHHVGSNQVEQGHVELRDHIAELDSDHVRYLAYMLAGAAAEKRQTGQYSPRDTHDREHAIIAASAVLQVERDSPRVAAAVRDAQLLANSLMTNDRLWAWVQRTATALIRRRRLTGRQIAALRETP
jgi:hypothetical protein